MSKIPCPECGKELILIVKLENPARMVAFHNCGTGVNRAVIEKDNPEFAVHPVRIVEPVKVTPVKAPEPVNAVYRRSKRK